MRQIIFFYSLLLFLIIPVVKCAAGNIDRAKFYAVMKLGDLNAVDAQLAVLAKDPARDSRAFEGALLMKKAGLSKGPLKKLKLFKKGHTMLEDALKNNNDNPEFRFLRLMIQENAPGIVNYKGDLKTDSTIIQSNFKKMTTELQGFIIEYSKTSKVLSPANFKS